MGLGQPVGLSYPGADWLCSSVSLRVARGQKAVLSLATVFPLIFFFRGWEEGVGVALRAKLPRAIALVCNKAYASFSAMIS